MTLFVRDPIDSGEILDPAIVETHVLELGERGEHTRNLSAYDLNPPVLRRPDAYRTAEVPALRSIGIIPELGAPVAEYPVVSPAEPEPEQVVPGRHRGGRPAPRPAWQWQMLLVGLGVVGTVVVEVAVLVALAVIR